MPDTTRIMLGRTSAAVLLALAAVTMSAPVAYASQGSVPDEVASYAADPQGLVSRLDDLFGPGASGGGIEFGETTKVGQLNRVFTFTPEFLGDEQTDIPVERANEWSAPILIDDEPVGLATIWINPATVSPELADFEATPELAAGLTDVPAEAYVVHDQPRGAWFTLVESDLTTLAAGSSGASGELSLADYQQVLADAAAESEQAEQPVNTGAILSITIIGAAALAVVLVLLIPVIRGRTRKGSVKPAEEVTDSRPELEQGPTPHSEPEQEQHAETEPEAPVEAAAAPEPGTTDPAAKKPAATRPAAGASSAKKPAAKKTPAKPRIPKPAAEEPQTAVEETEG